MKQSWNFNKFRMDNLADFLNDYFPNCKISYLAEGDDSIAYMVDEDIVRFPKHPSGYKNYLFESKLTQFLRSESLLNVEVPEIFTNQINGIHYSQHRALKGHKWNLQTINSMSQKQRQSFIYSIIDILLNLAKTNISKLQKAVPELSTKSTVDITLNTDHLDYLANFFTPNEIQTIQTRYYSAKNNLKTEPQKVLLHNDFTGNNVLIDNSSGQITGIIDWCNSMIGSPLIDFCKLYNPVHNDLLVDLLSEYNFRAKTNVKIDQINELEIFNLTNVILLDNLDYVHLEIKANKMHMLLGNKYN